jgi:hypothetical protein
VKGVMSELATQRWDDHRYYHHSRINQSLHLLSATSFLVAYVLLFINPAAAAIVGWCVSMTSRQAGHFFFEPRGYDQVNRATDAYKEAVKVGYNIRRKVVLMSAWLLVPLALLPGASFKDAASVQQFLNTLGLWWLALAVAGLLLRVVQLWISHNFLTGITWALKILTDPFHDIMLYYKAPLYLLRGEFIDPMPHVRRH